MVLWPDDVLLGCCQVRSLAEASSGGDQQIEALQKELAAVQEVSEPLVLCEKKWC